MEAENEERVCHHWFIPLPIKSNDKYISFKCDHCDKTGLREDFFFHLKTCPREYCSKVISFERANLRSILDHMAYNGHNYGAGNSYTRYCNECYYIYYDILGTYPYSNVNDPFGWQKIQRIWSKRARVPGFKTKNANKV